MTEKTTTRQKGDGHMEQVVHKFRTTIGGFNRRDVLNYIESMSIAHRKQLDELQAKLDQTEHDRDELADTLSGLRDEKGSAAEEEARTRASLEESSRTLSRVRGELSQAESKLAVARSQLARLQEQVDQLEPQAKSYEELKERVATVELDAHKKAQATVDEAQTQAEAIRREAQAQADALRQETQDQTDAIRQETCQWLDQTLEQYDQLRKAVDGLDGQLAAMGQLSAQVKENDQVAERLRQWREQQ
jgi:chromosome segregation ATPase